MFTRTSLCGSVLCVSLVFWSRCFLGCLLAFCFLLLPLGIIPGEWMLLAVSLSPQRCRWLVFVPSGVVSSGCLVFVFGSFLPFSLSLCLFGVFIVLFVFRRKLLRRYMIVSPPYNHANKTIKHALKEVGLFHY